MYNRSLHFHFTGIGGSGMSGIAEILVNNGYVVSGSDLSVGAACKRLMNLGVEIHQGHSADYLPEQASLVVYSSAVSLDNPELVEARRRGLPVVQRAEVLAELMRLKFGVAVAGAHGKTTTTSMVGWLLEMAGFDPTVIIGGQVKARGSGGRSGRGEYLVAEADESDRSFLLLKPTVALVTNIDREHMESYGSEEDLRAAFRQFLNSIPFYGLAVVCVDDPYLRQIASEFQKRMVTYGFSDEAEIRGVVENISHDGLTLTVYRKGSLLFTARIPLLGRHLAQNALGAIAVALEFGMSPEAIAAGFANFPGVERRLEHLGMVEGITVFSDYGHHPVEVRATLAALRECYAGRISRFLVLFQPHRYSRTRDSYTEFLSCFQDCDEVHLIPIYPAGEEPLPGISSEALAKEVVHDSVCAHESLEHGLAVLAGKAAEGDLVLLLGAGSIGRETEQFLRLLRAKRTAA
ncbi:MAG: UDP-N-acetylmuramate--L-alanine ligase [Bdellovibrionales bacterium]|nr:UDP-N-acetylmuramate--L-alanine ligase [Bdellovibrionales bacterium]